MRRSCLAVSFLSMAFSDSYTGPNGPCLSFRSRLLSSFFLATHNRPLPMPLFREQTSVSFAPAPFGNTLAMAKGTGLKVRDQATLVMNVLRQFTKLQYAVIQLSSTTDPPQRLILAYRDERTLRALIAGPSIVGLGFGSREDAVSSENPALEKAVGPAPANELERARAGQHQLYCREGRAAAWSSVSSLLKLASIIVQFAFAATICILYSNNIVSATIRSVLAGSL